MSYVDGLEFTKDMLLSEAFSRWTESTTTKPNTRRSYAGAVRRAMGAGLVFLSDFRVERVAAYIRALREKGHVPRTIRTEVGGLCAVVQAVALERLFPQGELDSIRRLLPKTPRKARHGTASFLTPAEVEALAVAATKIAPRLELPIRIAALTGARVGELARMHREDFDLGPKPWLEITELGEWGERGTAKTGIRRVPVAADLKALVLARSGDAWLFPNEERTSWCGRKAGGRRPRSPFVSSWILEHELTFVRRAAELPEGTTFTTLRHTRASWWLQAGVSIYKVACWLGHSVRVCEAHYGGLVPYDPDCERMPEERP